MREHRDPPPHPLSSVATRAPDDEISWMKVSPVHMRALLPSGGGKREFEGQLSIVTVWKGQRKKEHILKLLRASLVRPTCTKAGQANDEAEGAVVGMNVGLRVTEAVGVIVGSVGPNEGTGVGALGRNVGRSVGERVGLREAPLTANLPLHAPDP